MNHATRSVKFGMEIHQTYVFKFCMKFASPFFSVILKVSEMAAVHISEVMSDRCQVI